MSNTRTEPPLFLLDQTLSQLNLDDPDEQYRFLWDSGRTPDKAEPASADLWKSRSRLTIQQRAASKDAERRVALMCAAGIGKTTNMQWVASAIAAGKRGQQVPFLFRLDRDSDIKRLESAFTDDESLMNWMAGTVAHCNKSGQKDRSIQALKLQRSRSGITMLLDGLDHVMGRADFLENLASWLASPPWKGCPVWVSGRPEAFRKWWADPGARSRWMILQVNALSRSETSFCLRWHTGHDWYDAFPADSRRLLATPRFLKLICGSLSREVPRPPQDRNQQQEAVGALDMVTAAGVYYRAYFHVGNPSDPDSQGLLAQGLRGENERITLGGRKPSELNLPERVTRMGLVLGAAAFYMFAMNSDDEYPEPNITGVSPAELIGNVGPKLEALSLGTAQQFEDDLNLLRQMNNHQLEFLVFNNDLSDSLLVFSDRTVQAFFAAYWAVKYAPPEHLGQTLRWIGLVDSKDNRLTGFDEFWTFAAEMPVRVFKADRTRHGMDLSRWLELFSRCYTPPQELTKTFTGKTEREHEWVQWHRRMIYHTWPFMKERARDRIAAWRQTFVNLANGTTRQREIHSEIVSGFRQIRAGTCACGSDPLEEPPNPGVEREVEKNFLLHQWPVTNRMYESFDPAHRVHRWKNRWNSKGHPLTKTKGRQGEDYCPVVNVTWYDAWCFAAWCDCYIPTELEWEHACRAGTTTAWYFGDREGDLALHAWYRDNSEGHTHPMPPEVTQEHRNANLLYDMHGNVWEWCADWWDPDASSRVLRGGSWGFNGGNCRSAYRDWSVPGDRYQDYGFRLAAVPGLEPSKGGKRGAGNSAERSGVGAKADAVA